MNFNYNKMIKQYKSIILNIFLEIDYYFDEQETSEFCYDKNYKELYPTTILNYIKCSDN